MMANIGGWNTAQYIAKKQLHGGGDNVTYHKREIMPQCVLDLCRQKYPNPKGQPYMGHKWN
jgi:hypothetical protein